ncbi:MAG TPA: 8-amino-7-oxononanoate synthase [Phycisphaerales bacterium]|nr:8-amino-7-oxononanoate synthase [Phycisphaerales bacterium]
MTDFGYLTEQLERLRAAHLFRACQCIDSSQGPVVRMVGDGEKVLFCSNDYLNLAEDPRVIEAACRAMRTYGFGSAAARLISGTMRPHVALEQAAADFLGKQAALYLPSGWAANQALLTTLPQKGDLVLMDRYDHASIIDAVRSCPAEFRTYRRDRPDRLRRMLEQGGYQRTFIVTESVFSMDGDCAELSVLVEFKQRYGAILIVDEAHGLGCLGKTGAGLAQQQGLLEQVDVVVAPLGKAVGASGGLIVGPRKVIDYVVNKARPFIFTTAPPPAIAAGATEALNLIQSEPQRRVRLQQNAARLREQLTGIGLDIGQSTTHIIPILLGSSEKALAVSAALYEAGYYVAAIRPPTVPPGSARLRLSVQSGHTHAQLEGLCRAIQTAINTQ